MYKGLERRLLKGDRRLAAEPKGKHPAKASAAEALRGYRLTVGLVPVPGKEFVGTRRWMVGGAAEDRNPGPRQPTTEIGLARNPLCQCEENDGAGCGRPAIVVDHRIPHNGAIAFSFIGFETKGRTFEEMDNTVDRRAAASP